LDGKVTLRRTYFAGAGFERDRLGCGIVAPVYTIVVQTSGAVKEIKNP
jgi:hypothetical protein